MSAILGSAVTGAGGSSAYTVDNSLRFRASASAKLARTPSSQGSLTTWTYSFWLKMGYLGTANAQNFIMCRPAGNQYTTVYIGQVSGVYALHIDHFNGSQIGLLKSANQFRDPSAWYHIVCVFDTTNATSSDRLRMYVNGNRITSFTDSPVYPAQNTTGFINTTGAHNISSDPTYGGSFIDGYLAEVNFIDGQALTPSSFGATNSDTGVWQPKAYTGSYGTNGFYLKFSDIATTSGSNSGLGKDFSGNGNYWNTNNISVTAGVTYDAMTDSPTPASSTVGNYCVMNPLMPATYGPSPDQKANVTNGNLTITDAGGTYNSGGQGTIGVTSGKFYWEYTLGSTSPQYNGTGISFISGWDNNQYGISYDPYAGGGTIRAFVNASPTTIQSGLGSASSGDIIAVALDCDAQTVKWYKNNVQVGSTVTYTSYLPSNSTTVWPAWWTANALGASANVNFGQRPFTYTPPTGYNRLQTYNLPTPTIGASSTTLAGKYFNAVLYSGNGTTNTITGLGFQPDFLWFKNRNGTGNNSLNDTNRGITKRLISDSTNAEDTISSISSLNSDGFVLTGNDGSYNYSVGPRTYVTWCWKANAGTNSTNTNGSITSTVQANTTSGFSIVKWTGTGASGTTGHGLGVAPKMIILKDATNAYNWYVFTTATGSNLRFEGLNTTSAATSQPSQFTTTSTLIENIPGIASLNTSGATMVAYCFAEKAGFSRIGSYTGNGSTDGTFVYTGFRPRYVMIKRTDISGDGWTILDTSRSPYNVAKAKLEANADLSESTAYSVFDILSNGFKFRDSDRSWNGSGGNYIYMAFAENPFNYSLAR